MAYVQFSDPLAIDLVGGMPFAGDGFRLFRPGVPVVQPKIITGEAVGVVDGSASGGITGRSNTGSISGSTSGGNTGNTSGGVTGSTC